MVVYPMTEEERYKKTRRSIPKLMPGKRHEQEDHNMGLVLSWRENTSVKPLLKPVEFATNCTMWQRCASRDIST